MLRFAFTIFLLFPVTAFAGEWPTYRHDNRRSGVSEENLNFPLKPLWTHQGGTPRQAWSGPAKWDAFSGNAGLQSMRNFDPCYYVTIDEGQVYYGSSHDNAVHALDAKSGSERWVFFTEAPVRLPPTLFDGAVYAGSDDGHLYALNSKNGKLIWKDHGAPSERRIPSNASLISLWPVRTSALIANDSLYYAASLTPWESSWLVSVDPKSGQRKFAEEMSGVTLQGALLATAETLIAPQGRSSPLLFDAKTGKAAGALSLAGGVFCLVTEDEQILAGPISQKAKDSQLLLTNPEGKKVATFNDTTRAVLSMGTAYLHTRGKLKAIRYAENSAELWSVITPIPSELIVCENAVLIGLGNSLSAYSRESGELLWTAEVDGRVHGLAITNGTLVASTSLGAIHAFGP